MYVIDTGTQVQKKKDYLKCLKELQTNEEIVIQH